MKLNEAKLDPSELEIYREAQELLRRGTDAIAFSARFFGAGGRLARPEAAQEERRAVVDSALYRWLKQEYARLRKQGASAFEQEVAAQGQQKTPPRRLTVVVPCSVHEALKVEALSEGVSLSELMCLKLAMPYRDILLLTKQVAPRRHRSAVIRRP